jgi:hypothetical protein
VLDIIEVCFGQSDYAVVSVNRIMFLTYFSILLHSIVPMYLFPSFVHLKNLICN